ANISEILKDMVSDFQAAAEHKKISLELDVPEKDLNAYIDMEAFHKIISNLLDNALKYGERKVHVLLSRQSSNNDFFHIEVKNDGPIIPRQLHERIFEPFYRMKETEIKPGTGIGLSLARALAELHNGTLFMRHHTDHFNVFIIELPIHQSIEFNLKGKWKKF
ncbi:two-component system sensor histidine kinase/response regulator, hybrid ('one-component system'), partial [Pedobacter sp. BAL39]|uniref:sensor histidine kinase n=1 Tax=Pedobacter sp. BAL39 TaxID=391596 RepID=UPI000155A14F